MQTQPNTWKDYFKYRFFGMIMCAGLWTLIILIRVFLSSFLPPILMYPIMCLIGFALFAKFFAFICNQDDYGLSSIFVVCMMTFIVLLTGSLPLLMLSAACALLSWQQEMVRFAAGYKQQSKSIAIGLFGFVLVAIIVAASFYLTVGAVLPVMVALIAVNLCAVSFYILNHPTTFQHYKEISSFVVTSLDFFAFSILMHTLYVPLCILAPSLFSLALSTGVVYTFHSMCLMFLTLFVSRPMPESKDLKTTQGVEEFGLNETGSLSAQDIPVAKLVQPDSIPEGFGIGLLAMHVYGQISKAFPSAPPMPEDTSGRELNAGNN